jgi:hypothetical protein
MAIFSSTYRSIIYGMIKTSIVVPRLYNKIATLTIIEASSKVY